MKIKSLLFTLAFLSMGMTSFSQDYINAVGARFGSSQGISGKHFISTTDAVEGILATRWGGFNLTGLWERHTLAFDVDALYFYYGAGAHVGFWDNTSPWFDSGTSTAVIGIDGIVGLEYNFSEIPFNISLDYKPAFNLIGYTGFWGDSFGLSFRFVF